MTNCLIRESSLALLDLIAAESTLRGIDDRLVEAARSLSEAEAIFARLADSR